MYKSNVGNNSKFKILNSKLLRHTISLIEKESKSERWMPWLSEAMKDVVSCDKLRVGANDL